MKTVIITLVILFFAGAAQAAKTQHFSKNSFASVSSYSHCEERDKLASCSELSTENEITMCTERVQKIQLAGSDIRTVDPDKESDIRTVDPDKESNIRIDDPDKESNIRTVDPDKESNIRTVDPDKESDIRTVDPDKESDIKTIMP